MRIPRMPWVLSLLFLCGAAAAADRGRAGGHEQRPNELGCPCAAHVSCFGSYCDGTAAYSAFLATLSADHAAEVRFIVAHKAALASGHSTANALAQWGIDQVSCGDRDDGDEGRHGDGPRALACGTPAAIHQLGGVLDACFGEVESLALQVSALTAQLGQCHAAGAPALVFEGSGASGTDPGTSFGNLIGGTRSTLALSFANNGTGGLLLDSFAFDAGAPFSLTAMVPATDGALPCIRGMTLVPGASCRIYADFAPPPLGYLQTASFSSALVIGYTACDESFSQCASASPLQQLSLTVTGTSAGPACAAGFQLFESSGTFTVAAGCSGHVRVLAIGGGGAGGVYPGSGGGSGIVASGSFSVSAPVAITVGGPGAISSFGNWLSAGGGSNGAGGDGAPGGAGGSSGGGKYSSNSGGRGGIGGGRGGERNNELGNGAASQGPFPLSSFTHSTIAPGDTPSTNFEGGGGGGGVVINGSTVNGGDSQNTGYGGQGYGAGGGGGNASIGAPGVVYVEWDD